VTEAWTADPGSRTALDLVASIERGQPEDRSCSRLPHPQTNAVNMQFRPATTNGQALPNGFPDFAFGIYNLATQNKKAVSPAWPTRVRWPMEQGVAQPSHPGGST